MSLITSKWDLISSPWQSQPLAPRRALYRPVVAAVARVWAGTGADLNLSKKLLTTLTSPHPLT